MKKLILISVLITAGAFMAVSQTVRLDSIVMPVGADTTKWLAFASSKSQALNFDYSDLTSADVTLDFGSTMHPDSTSIFNRLDDTRIPYTLNGATYSLDVVFLGSYPNKYLLIKTTRNSSVAGEVIYIWRW